MAPETVAISRDLLNKLTRRAAAITARQGIGPGDDLWDLAYQVGRLAFDSRVAIYDDDFTRLVHSFFSPRNAKERDACTAIIWKLVYAPAGGNTWLGTASDDEVRSRFSDASERLKNGGWQELSIGPKSTPMLRTMRMRALSRRSATVN